MAENDLLKSRADAAVLSRDFALAARLYNTLLQQSPNDVELLEKLGSIYVKSGNDEKALSYYIKSNQLKPNDFNTLNNLGGIYRRLRQYEKSIEVLKQALSLNKNVAQVNYNLGFTYKIMEKYDKAVECFESVIQSNPDDVLAYNHLGLIYQSRGENQKAIQTFLKALKVDRNHPILHLNLAKSYEQEGQLKNAVAEYEAALRSKPVWSEAIYEYSKLLLLMHKTNEAKELVSQAISVDPADIKMHSTLGDIYSAQSDFENSAEEYKKVISVEPNNKNALVELSASLEENGNPIEALEYIERAEKENPEDRKVMKQSASVSLSANRVASAGGKIKHLLSQDRYDCEALDLAGQFYIVKKDDDKSENFYSEIKKLDSNYTQYLLQAAKRYKQVGELDKAEGSIKQYIKKNPSDAKALTTLAGISESLGKINDSILTLKKALQLDSNNVAAKKSLHRISVQLTDVANNNELGDFTTESLLPVEEEKIEENDEPNNIIQDENNELQNSNNLLADENLLEKKIADDTALVDNESSSTDSDLWKSESWDPDELVDESENPFAELDGNDESILTGKSETSSEEIEDEVENEEYDNVPELKNISSVPKQNNGAMADSENPKNQTSGDKIEDDKTKSVESSDEPKIPEPESLSELETDLDSELNPFSEENDFDSMPRFTKDSNQDLISALEDEDADGEYDNVPELKNIEPASKQNNGAMPDSENQKNQTSGDKIEDDEIEEDKIKSVESSDEPEILELESLSELETDLDSELNPFSEENDFDSMPSFKKDSNEKLIPHQKEVSYNKNRQPQIARLSDKDNFRIMSQLQKTQAEADKAIAAANKAWIAANHAADATHAASVTESLLTERTEDAVMQAAKDVRLQAEQIVKDVADKMLSEKIDKIDSILPQFEKILEKSNSLEPNNEQTQKILTLFKSLRALGESLSGESRKSFLQSLNRIKMDYIISRLSGNPGLLKVSQQLRESGKLENYIHEDELSKNQNYSGKFLAFNVFKNMKDVAKNLDDKDLSLALEKIISNLVEKISQ